MRIDSTKSGNLFDGGVRKTTNLQVQEIAIMFKIVQFPKKLQPFFEPLREQFLWDHFHYFRLFVLLIAFAWGRRNVCSLYRYLDETDQPHRSRFNNFLNLTRWQPAVVLALKAQELLAALSPQPGETVELILDDSKKRKRGKAMQAVCWMKDPLTSASMRGHQYVTAVLSFRGYTIPFGVRLYVKKEDCRRLQRPFRKTTELAAELIREFQRPQGVQVRVLFDSFYLCPVVVKACRAKGFHFISTLKSNRNLFRKGRKLKAGAYGRHLFRRSGTTRKTFAIQKEHGSLRYTCVDAGWMKVSSLGRLHVVFSRKQGEPKILGLVTDDPKLSARQIITAYDHRWQIEVFFKDGKQLLGLGHYQNLSYEAAVNHLHLVFLAYALLTHMAIGEGRSAQGRQTRTRRRSIADLQNELRRLVWDDLTKHLRHFSGGTEVIKELQRLLVAA
jgi:hypothetical protein